MQLSFTAAFLWLVFIVSAVAYSIESGLVSVNGNKAFDFVPDSEDVHRVVLESVREKVALSVVLKGNVAEKPHQLNFVFTDNKGLDYATYPLFDTTKKTATSLILVNKIPPALLSQERVFVYIIAADASQKKGQNLYTLLAELVPSESLRASVNYKKPLRLGALPEIHHQFNEDPQTVKPIVPLIFSAVAIALFFVLIGSWFTLVGNSLFVANEGIPFKGGFLTTIALIEFTFVKYYLGATIFTTIFYTAILAGPALVFGSKALKALTKQRTVIEATT